MFTNWQLLKDYFGGWGHILVAVAVVESFGKESTYRTNQAPPYLCTLFHDKLSVSGRSTRNMSQLNLPKCRLSTGQHSFVFHGAKEYNLLPENIRNLNNTSSFKRKVHCLANSS